MLKGGKMTICLRFQGINAERKQHQRRNTKIHIGVARGYPIKIKG